MPRLSERYVRRAKPRATKYEVTCAEVRGFVLRVLPSGKKSYYVRYRTPEGRDRRARIGDVREVSFAAARRRALEVAAGGDAALPGIPTARAFARRFLEQHADRHLKPRTRRKYRQLARHVVARFGDTRLDAITRAAVADWHGSMAATPCEANAAARLLSCMYSRAIDWGVLPDDYTPPTRRLRMYRQRGRERFLTPAERRALESYLERGLAIPAGRRGHLRWHSVAAIRLLSLTGMRRDEVLDLTWGCVDVRHRCLRLRDSKTGPRVVPLGTPALELLEALRRRAPAGAEHVIVSRSGGRVASSVLTGTWIRVRDRIPELAGVRLHDLRHSAASDALMSGVPLAVVGRVLGHRHPSSTARYAHISDAALADAAERMATTVARHAAAE